MSYQTGNLSWLREHVMKLALAAVALVLVLMSQSAPTAHGQEPQPPPDDCWNGALSGDTLHCYILEEAQKAGEIEVAAMYEAPGGPLYIFLRQDEPIGDRVSSYFKQKAYEFMEGIPGYGKCRTSKCDRFTGDQRSNCLDQLMGWPMWRSYHTHLATGLPKSRAYEQILLFVGGSEARRSEPGWASWRQVWPVVEGGSTDGAEGFDVSDVDVTNFPELDCVKEAPRFSSGVGAGCLAWANHSSAGVAGWRYSYPDGNALYIQVKSAPVDEKALEALKGQLVPPRLKANYEAGKLKLVIIRVKYDFEELWHWSVILDRFAVSAGNTVGIASAEIGGNHGGYQKPVVWPLEDLKKVSLSETSEIREKIVVWALDPQVAAAAMPELLPRLGIPLDAVGIIAHADRSVEPPVPAGGSSLASDVPSSIGSTSDAPVKATTDTAQTASIAADEPPTERRASGSTSRCGPLPVPEARSP